MASAVVDLRLLGRLEAGMTGRLVALRAGRAAAGTFGYNTALVTLVLGTQDVLVA